MTSGECTATKLASFWGAGEAPPSYAHLCVSPHRVINGVKEMCGFRISLNLSYSSTGNESCTKASCSENLEESTILVNHAHPPS